MKIIAELCQNHNGQFDILKEMVKSAVNAGATHIKIQHINPEILNYANLFASRFEPPGSERPKVVKIFSGKAGGFYQNYWFFFYN